MASFFHFVFSISADTGFFLFSFLLNPCLLTIGVDKSSLDEKPVIDG